MNVVALLLDKMKGPDVSVQNRERRTALYLAAEGGYKPVVELLLGEAADVSVSAQDGKMALDRAAA